jgi:ATP-dependent DNA helicase RecQ
MGADTFDREQLRRMLRVSAGREDATFRPQQEEAIRSVVADRQRLLLVQRTGWGKSFVYFATAKLLREAGLGPTLIVSPLLALMRNQILAAKRMGVRAETVNSSNVDEWEDVFAAVASGEVDALLISPERLTNERFQAEVLPRLAEDLGMLVVDEAHCVSDWGHDFRPEYRLLERLIRRLPPTVRLVATTATANARVMEDLADVLGPDLTIVQGELHRPSLKLQTIRLPLAGDRMAWLADRMADLEGTGIIYTLTIRDARRVARWLQSCGFEVAAYDGAEDADRRLELEEALLGNRLKALVSTSALGMGFDKPDLSFVIHYQAPGSAVAYYQQVGRAGRAVSSAYGVLLSGEEDTDITSFFIDSAFPSPDECRRVLDELAASRTGLSVPQLLGQLNIRKNRVEKVLKMLSLEAPAPVVKVGTKWVVTGAAIPPGFWGRAERLAVIRRREQAELQDYVRLTSGHMHMLVGLLDGDASGYEEPDLPDLPVTPTPTMVEQANAFLRRTGVPVEPRRKWPDGGLSAHRVRGHIDVSDRAEEGRTLCHWRDGGLAELVRIGKQETGRFDDRLVAASVEAIRHWETAPDPAPTWVTCVPSLLNPELVPDFAQRLADALGLPFRSTVEQISERPPQKTMANSNHQARNVDGKFGLTTADVPPGPVLLVDDIIDSRWTTAVIAMLLRRAGSGPVHPFALALTG